MPYDDVEARLQALIDVETADRIGAERFEAHEHAYGPAQRDRNQLLATKARRRRAEDPKLRKGSSFPSIRERRHTETERSGLSASGRCAPAASLACGW